MLGRARVLKNKLTILFIFIIQSFFVFSETTGISSSFIYFEHSYYLETHLEKISLTRREKWNVHTVKKR